VYGAAGLASMKVTATGLDGGIAKFYASQATAIVHALGANPGDLILLVGAERRTACLSSARCAPSSARAGADEGRRVPVLLDRGLPLFEWNAEAKKWDPAHHMFTMPQERFLADFESRPAEVKGDLYDLVCNGVELASGSIRIHESELQRRVFRFLGMSDAERSAGSGSCSRRSSTARRPTAASLRASTGW